MADPRVTITEVERTLDAERLNCQWNSTAFSASPYVYISKTGVALLWRLLARAKEECDLIKTYEGEYTKTAKELAGCIEEMNHVADDNDQLRRELQGRMAEVHAKDVWLDKVTGELRSLRSVFGGTAKTHAELQEILARVDEVLRT